MAERRKSTKRAGSKPARKSKSSRSNDKSVLEELQAQRAQNEQLRTLLEQQTGAAQAMKSRLTAINPSAQNPYSELMVGIRNVSDNTIGIPAMNGQPPIQLLADFGEHEPGSTSVIPYAQWRELVKGKLVRNGAVVRDDSVVGPGLHSAPVDRPSDLPQEAAYNAILDPKQWIDSRTEDEIQEDLERITSEESLQRIRRAVDDALRALEARRPRNTKDEQIEAAKWAMARLPAKYRKVDELITERLEAPEAGEDWESPIWITPSGRGWSDKRGSR